MKKLKKIIIIVSILILIVIVSIIFYLNSGNNITKEQQNITEEETDFSEELLNGKIQRSEYNSIYSAINTYFQRLNLNDTSYDNTTISDNEKKQMIINLLSEEYIKENDISVENLEKKLEILQEKNTFLATQMKCVNEKNIKTYVISGYTQNIDYKYMKDICLIVNIDYQNSSFSIEPTNEKFENINKVKQLKLINKNEYNQINAGSVNIENIVKDYISIYKRMILSRADKIYDILDEEYRKARFGNKEFFEEYIEKNKEELQGIRLEEYLVNNYDDYIEYVGKDQYGNIYIFKEKNILDYTIELDDYTLEDEEYIKTYNSSTDQYKVVNNINIWIKMINNRDYNSAYEVLDETFRNENFESVEKFEEYMRQYFPAHYEIEFEETDKQGNYYTQKILLTDVTGEDTREIERTIVMLLKENTEFKMSFNFPTKSAFD